MLIRKYFRLRHWHPFRGHPFVVPVLTTLFLVFISAVIFVAFNSSTVGAEDSHVVKVSVDGTSQTLPTRAATVGDLLKRLNINVDQFDIVEPSADTAIIEDDFHINVYHAQPVTIVDSGGKKLQTFSAESTPRLVAQKAGFVLYPEDVVNTVQPQDSVKEGIIGAKVEIKRATLLHMNIYGTPVEVRTQATTIGTLLEEKNFKLNEGDTVQPDLSTPISSETVVFIVAKGKQIVTSEETIPAPLETILDSNLSESTTHTQQAGSDGKKLTTYEVDVATGAKRSLQEIVLVQAQKKIIVKGTRPLFADYSPDGIPAQVFCGSPHQRNWKNINIQNAAIGRTLAAQYGWTGSQFNALLELWACESSWNHLAGNPYSGAYGIPQALPGSKMSAAGEDWFTNPKTQIIWGLGYIQRGYGSPAAALAHHYAYNYY